MLPNILDIAEQYGVIIDKKSYGKKETRAKCPFCLEDANKPKKFYLSLNTVDQVYRCWFCGVSGGVLDFEAKLTDTSFEEIKEKYFSKNKQRVLHPAETLTMKQLKEIGWEGFRKNKEAFMKHRDLVFKEWQRYEHKVLSELYAELLVIMKLPNEIRNELLIYFKKRCENTPIRDCYYKVTEEYKKQSSTTAWVNDGLKIARISWRICQMKNDFTKVLVQVPFLHYLYFYEKESGNQSQHAG